MYYTSCTTLPMEWMIWWEWMESLQRIMASQMLYFCGILLALFQLIQAEECWVINSFSSWFTRCCNVLDQSMNHHLLFPSTGSITMFSDYFLCFYQHIRRERYSLTNKLWNWTISTRGQHPIFCVSYSFWWRFGSFYFCLQSIDGFGHQTREGARYWTHWIAAPWKSKCGSRRWLIARIHRLLQCVLRNIGRF